jgi:2-haloacid dehalogenase
MFYRILPKYPFLGWFQDIVISGEVGFNKPDPRIFQILLDRVNRPAGDCLLIDDSQKNIQTAQDLGFQTILFQSPAQLREELMRQNCWDHH